MHQHTGGRYWSADQWYQQTDERYWPAGHIYDDNPQVKESGQQEIHIMASQRWNILARRSYTLTGLNTKIEGIGQLVMQTITSTCRSA